MTAKVGINSSILLLATILSGVLFLFSCGRSPEKVPVSGPVDMMDDTLINYNKELVRNESQEIADFIRRYRLTMKTSQTGLRYMIYKHGKGDTAEKGDFVTIKYSVHLLNGDVVFQTDSLESFTFEIGRRKVPNGLEEGIMLMKPGEKAKLIVPSHLAYGLIGDLDKVPNRAILVYDVEICVITRPN